MKIELAPNSPATGDVILPSALALRWKIWEPYAKLDSRRAGNPSVEDYRKTHTLRMQRLLRVGISLGRIKHGNLDNPMVADEDWDGIFIKAKTRRGTWNKLGERAVSPRLYKPKRLKTVIQAEQRRKRALCRAMKSLTIDHLPGWNLNKLFSSK